MIRPLLTAASVALLALAAGAAQAQDAGRGGPRSSPAVDHGRDDPDAYAQAWRRASYEPPAEQPVQRAGESRDFVAELLGPAAEAMRDMPKDQPKPRVRPARARSAAAPTASRTPPGQDPSLIFE